MICTSYSNWACNYYAGNLLQSWSIGWEVFREMLSWWILMHNNKLHTYLSNVTIHFLVWNVCRLLCHVIFNLFYLNMSCTLSKGFACVHILWKWKQQRGLKSLYCLDHRVSELRKLSTFCLHLFWGLFISPTLFAAAGHQPWFSTQQNNRPFLYLSELMHYFVV